MAGFRILPLWIPEMDFSEWIPDSFCSEILDSKRSILDSNVQYSGFHKQKMSLIPEPGLPEMGRITKQNKPETCHCLSR